ncbi:MAG: M20/M25/M40 family metallo-hydrolase [Vicinamibacterales bacterium]
MSIRRWGARWLVGTSVFSLVAVAGFAQGVREVVDAAANAKIRDEGLNRSKVDPMFTMLVDTIGPRLAGSPEYKRSAEWGARQMRSFGLTNVVIEPFEFSRGWVLDKFTIEMVEPRYMPLVGYPEAWSPSTQGEVIAPVAFIAGKTAEEVEALQAKGALNGAALLNQPAVTNFIRTDRVNPTAPGGIDAPLATAPQAAAQAGRGGRGGRGGADAGIGPTSAERITTAMRTGGAAVWLRPSRGEHGTLFVQAGTREVAGDTLPRVVLIGEHYNLLTRLAAQGATVKVRVNVQAHLLDDRNCYNVVGEIAGTDPVLKDEVIMMGAHLDSWHTATGATDNADGVVALLEAVRILKAAGVSPRRTIRVALWGAEEEGLLGSAAYVQKHLAGDANKASRDKLATYFNIDPGNGPIYGWFMENNEAVPPIFDAWMEPFRDLGFRRNVRPGIGNTDHLSFIRAGMIGFNPVQDYENYDVREHHTNVDTAERVIIDDLKQNAIVLASVLYHAAIRPQRLPAPPRAGGGGP